MPCDCPLAGTVCPDNLDTRTCAYTIAHLAFVHTHALGGSEEYAYKTKPVAIEKLDDGFRVECWHIGADPPPHFRWVLARRIETEKSAARGGVR